MMNAWVALFTSFLVAVLLVAAIRRLALRAGLLDVPNARSSHLIPTPRGGGLAIVIVTLVATAIGFACGQLEIRSGLAWLVGGGIVALTGFLDDLRGVGAGSRLALHFLAAAILLAAAGGLPSLPWPGGPIWLGAFGWPLGALAIVWSINLFNFMDGIDGLAAAQTVFVAGSAAALQASAGSAPLPLLGLTGAAAGFLVWNFPPARIFMGDAGSGFVGYAFAAAAILPPYHGALTLWTWLILNGLFFADATVTLTVRLIHGQRVYEAHRSHLYQRLSRRWQSHQTVTLIAIAINLLWCLPWAAATVFWPTAGPVLAAAALAPLGLIAVLSGGGSSSARSPLP
jgi:Fuc2NAc and GlcNAc transferase